MLGIGGCAIKVLAYAGRMGMCVHTAVSGPVVDGFRRGLHMALQGDVRTSRRTHQLVRHLDQRMDYNKQLLDINHVATVLKSMTVRLISLCVILYVRV